jgi:hypothetical protein
VTNKQNPTTMSKQTHSPFPWTTKPTVYGTTKLVDAEGTEFGALFNKRIGDKPVMNQNAAMVVAIPGLLMAAMRGHGWGDPLHIEAHPNCTMCHAIRIAVGERTLDRVLELAKANSDHVLELLEECSTPEEGWREVERFLGIAEGDPYCAERRNAGEYEGIDLDIFDACANA